MLHNLCRSTAYAAHSESTERRLGKSPYMMYRKAEKAIGLPEIKIRQGF